MKIACLQMISTESVEDNLAKVKSLVDSFTDDYDLLVLPENFALMTDQDKSTIAEELGRGKIHQFISELAQSRGCWIQAGTIPVISPKMPRIYASAALFSDQGEIVCSYNKRFLFDVEVSEREFYRESDSYLAGAEPPHVIDTPLGRIGTIVCYDLRFAENILKLVDEQVDIILVPSAFTQKTGSHHWLALLKARAIEAQCYVVGCNQGGKHPNGRHTFGHSAIFDPYGKSLAQLKEGEGIITGEVDFDYIARVRAAMPMHHSRQAVNDA